MVAVAERAAAVVAGNVPRALPVSVGLRRRRRRPGRLSRRQVAHALSSSASVVNADARLAQFDVAVDVRRALAGRAGHRRGRHRGREMISIPVRVVVGDNGRQH